MYNRAYVFMRFYWRALRHNRSSRGTATSSTTIEQREQLYNAESASQFWAFRDVFSAIDASEHVPLWMRKGEDEMQL